MITHPRNLTQIPKMEAFKWSHLFQTMILEFPQLVFRGVIGFTHFFQELLRILRTPLFLDPPPQPPAAAAGAPERSREAKMGTGDLQHRHPRIMHAWCKYCMYIWVLPKIGVPPNHPF